MVSSEVAVATGTVKIAPMLERIRLGLYISVRGSHTMTASAPAASALLRTAPRLPGFSTASSTTTRGFSFTCRASRLISLQCSSAITPSVPPLYATLSYRCCGISTHPHGLPATASSISLKSASEMISGQKNMVNGS